MKKLLSMLLLVGLCCGMLLGCTTQKNEPVVLNDEPVADEPVVQDEELNDTEGEETDKTTPEEEEALEKEKQESLTVYADMINEIQTDFPEITVNYVVGTDDGGKDMSIDITLLESKDATTYKLAELTVTKETLMNNNGITGISVFVMNNDECAGIILFENQAGRFEPTVNTL